MEYNEALGGEMSGSLDLTGGGEGVDAPLSVLARAQELHLQAQAVGVHAPSSRLEMAAKAQRLLEGLITSLSRSSGPGVA